MKMTIRFILQVPTESYLQIFEEQVNQAVNETHTLFCTQVERKSLQYIKAHYTLSSANPYAFFKIAKIHSVIENQAARFNEEEDAAIQAWENDEKG